MKESLRPGGGGDDGDFLQQVHFMSFHVPAPRGEEMTELREEQEKEGVQVLDIEQTRCSCPLRARDALGFRAHLHVPSLAVCLCRRRVHNSYISLRRLVKQGLLQTMIPRSTPHNSSLTESDPTFHPLTNCILAHW